MKILLLLTVVGAFFMAANICWAEIPQLINYQGMLTDNAGNPINEPHDLTFTLYDAPTNGTALWTETHAAVPIANGLFNIILGGQTTPVPDSVFDEPERYLGIKVGTDPELIPRIQLTGVAYAYRANTADNALVADSALVATPGSGSHWSVSDSVLYTNNKWGISRGSAGNVLYGDNVHTHVNLGVVCTTGTSGQNIEYCTVGGGWENNASGPWATVGGGHHNTASTYWATVGGGAYNQSSGAYAIVGGGYGNITQTWFATVAGGESNTASGINAAVGGGKANTASGWFATIAGGRQNIASGNFSFAAGRRAQANHLGTFVWADSSVNADFASTSENQFLIRASGGVGIGTNSPDEKLHVENATGDNSIKISSANACTSSIKLFESNDYGFELAYAGNDDKLHLWCRKFSGNEGIRMTWLKNGDVGIGTTDPARDLHIASTGFAEIQLEKTGTTTNSWHISVGANCLYFTETDVAQRMTLENGGNVGIGTNDPAYRLDVNRDINVAGSYNIRKGGIAYTHPDYVFEANYNLMSLDELKKYVFENKCLPNVISSEDVKKNEGFKMDELLIQMLEKIEEQTLYIFQLEERIVELEKQNR